MTMKRYIEIIFDDSGSMNALHSSGVKKHEVAKEIVLKTILPILKSTDHVAVRTLRRKECDPAAGGGDPVDVKAGNDPAIARIIQDIKDFKKPTPLYLTIRDSLEACSAKKRSGEYDEFKVFVLTDGGDTCSHDLHQVISKEELKEWKVEFPNLEPVLVQFDVNSAITRNNLAQTMRALGGRSVLANDASISNLNSVRRTLRLSGFESNGKLAPCIESNPNASRTTWDDLSRSSIFFHQAQLLSEAKLLSFKPDLEKPISHDELIELKFLHAMAFASQIPLLLVRTMVAQLERPLLYSHDCIRWDFAKAKWVYIEQQEYSEFIEDVEASRADERILSESIRFHEDFIDRHFEHCFFAPDVTYVVTRVNTRFELRPEHTMNQQSELPSKHIEGPHNQQSSTKKNIRWLSPGTKVKFTDH